MPSNNNQSPPQHALFVEYGKFKAGAFGPIAVVALAVILMVLVGAYFFFGPTTPPTKLL